MSFNYNKKFLNIPNSLSISRIFLSLIFAFLLNGLLTGEINSFYALFVFIISILTDYLDGFIAKKTGNTTNLGAFIDVTADIFFVLISFLVLILNNKLSPVFLIVILIKFIEFIITSYLVKSDNILIFDNIGMNVSKFWIALPGIICLSYSLNMNFSSILINEIMLITSVLALISTVQRVYSFFIQ